jgi:hypothetical protein
VRHLHDTTDEPRAPPLALGFLDFESAESPAAAEAALAAEAAPRPGPARSTCRQQHGARQQQDVSA